MKKIFYVAMTSILLLSIGVIPNGFASTDTETIDEKPKDEMIKTYSNSDVMLKNLETTFTETNQQIQVT